MIKKLNPEIWINWFIKTATNGRTVAGSSKRLLTLLFLTVWLMSAYWLLPIFYKGCKGIYEYREVSSEQVVLLKDLSKGDSSLRFLRLMPAPGIYKQLSPIEKEMLHKMISGELPVSPNLEEERDNDEIQRHERRLFNAEQELEKLWALPMYLFCFFILPWLLLRITFWVIDADKPSLN